MKKSLLSVAVALSLVSVVGSISASTRPSFSNYQNVKPLGSFLTNDRMYKNQVAVEFSKPAFSLVNGVAEVLVKNLSGLTGVDVNLNRVMMGRFLILDLPGAKTDSDVLAAVNRIVSVPGVLEVIPNRLIKPASLSSFPNDGWATFQFPNYSAKRDFSGSPIKYDPRILELINFFETVNFGESRVAVVDGYFNETPNMRYADYAGTQTVKDGVFSSTLGNGFAGFPHGLAVSSYIAGKSNPYGTVGLARNLEVLGIDTYAGATSSSAFDIVEGVLYSVNLHSNAATNPNPKKATVINLSLGQPEGFRCDSVFQSMVDQVNNAGAIVVASSGNNGANTINAPANCTGSISVGAVGFDGKMADYSNKEPGLITSAISSTGSGAIYTTVTSSRVDGGSTESVAGTSFAAPYVSTLVAYAKSVDLSLSFEEVRSLLQRASVPFDSSDARCSDGSCGSVVDPVKFVQELSGQDLVAFNKYTGVAQVPEVPPTDGGGQIPETPQEPDPVVLTEATISLSGTASNPNNVVVFENGVAFGVKEVQVSVDQIFVDFGKSGQFVVEFTATPNTNTSMPTGSSAKYRVSVDTTSNPASVGMIERLTDPTVDDGSQVTPPPVPTAPQPSAASSGGGGSTSLPGLLALGVLIGWFRKSVIKK